MTFFRAGQRQLEKKLREDVGEDEELLDLNLKVDENLSKYSDIEWVKAHFILEDVSASTPHSVLHPWESMR